jgi:hypothetical protein
MTAPIHKPHSRFTFTVLAGTPPKVTLAADAAAAL